MNNLSRFMLFVLGLSLLARIAGAQDAPDAAQADPSVAPRTPVAPSVSSPPMQPDVMHEPRNETDDGTLALVFRRRAADDPSRIVVRFRSAASPTELEVTAERSDAGIDGWRAVIPPESVVEPVVEYYAVLRAPDGTERPLFASAEAPHPVVVVEPASRTHESEALRLRAGRRSRFSASAEYIDYGRRQLLAGGETLPDTYFRGELSYAYGILGVVEWLRFRAGVLRGSAAVPAAGVLTAGDIGLYYATSEITWYALSWLRIRTELVFGISQFGFAIGGAGGFAFGRDGGTQLLVHVEGVSDVGVTGSVKLLWRTVPRVPMGATVEVSSMPGGRDAGVRMLLDIGWEFDPGSVVRLWGGYQARTQVIGGPAIGAELVLSL